MNSDNVIVNMELKKDLLIAEREARAWSQSHLAEVTGLSLRTIQRIEKSGSASLESVKSLASVFEVSIDKLKADVDEPLAGKVSADSPEGLDTPSPLNTRDGVMGNTSTDKTRLNKSWLNNNWLNKCSTQANIIHLSLLVPILSLNLYLLWVDSEAIQWVHQLRDAIFSSTISQTRLDKISFLLLLLTLGLPCLLPGIIYDAIKRKGIFAKPRH
jgi:transcriptional regulator with XRE-family HTH domain